MSLEQLALIFILKNMGRVDDVKKHLIASLREMTLAVASSFEIINQTASEHNLGAKFPLAEILIKKADAILHYACAKIPAPDEAARLKAEVLNSVIDILDEESTKLKNNPGPSSALQREALVSIRKALAKRLQGDGAAGNSAAEEPENDALSTLAGIPSKRSAAL